MIPVENIAILQRAVDGDVQEAYRKLLLQDMKFYPMFELECNTAITPIFKEEVAQASYERLKEGLLKMYKEGKLAELFDFRKKEKKPKEDKA